MTDSYLALMDRLCLAKAKAEMARQKANDYCDLAHQAETDYAHSMRELERIEAELKWFRKQETEKEKVNVRTL